MGKQATRLYGEITKSEKQEDGTLMVYGYASAEVVDSDGEVVTADAMKAARDGYMAFANVREMHDPKKAAGVAVEYEVQEDGRTWFGAHVVDPVAVLKCETGVYKGFSIGAKVPKGGRDGKVIKSIELREVSLVDRPANPEAVFTLVKADGAADETDEDGEGEGGEQIQKGLYELRDFADVLRNIGYLVSSTGWEAQTEGDNSPIPAALLAWLKTGAGIFQAMAAEETAELLANLQAAVPTPQAVDVITASAEGGDLTKAGARFSKATKSALKAAHDACKAADAALAALKYEAADDADDDGDGDKAATAEGEDAIAKAAKAAQEAEELAKAEAAQVEEIAKAAGLDLSEPTADALTKAALTALVKARAEVEALKALPAGPKGFANSQGLLTKAADRGDGAPEVTPVVKHDGTVDEVTTLMKAAQARPISLS